MSLQAGSQAAGSGRGAVSRGQQREGHFHTGKHVSVTDGVAKNSLAESLIALGVIADVRGRGGLAWAPPVVLEREGGAPAWEDLEPSQEADPAAGPGAA